MLSYESALELLGLYDEYSEEQLETQYHRSVLLTNLNKWWLDSMSAAYQYSSQHAGRTFRIGNFGTATKTATTYDTNSYATTCTATK